MKNKVTLITAILLIGFAFFSYAQSPVQNPDSLPTPQTPVTEQSFQRLNNPTSENQAAMSNDVKENQAAPNGTAKEREAAANSTAKDNEAGTNSTANDVALNRINEAALNRVNNEALISTINSENPPSISPGPALKNREARTWNLQDADIISVINEVSLETGKNFIIDPRVQGKISLVSSKPIKPADVYQLFLSILELLGYSAIPNGNVVKIVPNMDSVEMSTRVASRCVPGKGDEVVVRVFPLQNVSASQLVAVVRPLLPQWSTVSSYTPGNVLIVVGRAGNLKRIDEIIQRIDCASNNDIDIVPLHRGSATQIVTVLGNLQNATRASGETPQISFAADERSNSILVSGNRAARLKTRMLIAQLDEPTIGAQDNTEVVYLRYLTAAKFAPILDRIARNLIGSDANVKNTVSMTATPPAGVYQTTVSSSQHIGDDTGYIKLTNIQAEPSSNALIITAPPALMRALHTIIAKLDVRPAQVLIEAIIVEIDQNNLNSLGIQWGSYGSQNDPAVTGGVGPRPIDFPPLGAGIVGIIPQQSIKAVLSILSNLSAVNILSTPSIVVLDNKTATLEVGKEVPYTTGQYATTGNSATVTPFNTIQNKPVTLKLDVTPQINLCNSVRLMINLKNDSLQNPENPGPNPIINTHKIRNSVIVDSCDILVIGGLYSNQISHNINKVPILGDVPVFGPLLFTRNSHALQKMNLLVFIKPIILHTETESQILTYNKYENIRNSQIRWPECLASEGEQKRQNILPKWQNDLKLPTPFVG